MEALTVELYGCARCGRVHPELVFEPLTNPVALDCEPSLTHWAPCPTNGEPILMRTDFPGPA